MQDKAILMQKHTFNIEIAGKDVRPETTRAGDLADFVAAMEKSILDTAAHQGIQLPDEAIVSLVEINEGSNRLKLVIAGVAITAAASVSTSIRTQNYNALPVSAHESLHKISNQAATRRWLVKIAADPINGIEEAIISPDNPVPSPDSSFLSGTTTLYGRCLTVGGATRPRAQIRLSGGQLLHIDLSEALACVFSPR